MSDEKKPVIIGEIDPATDPVLSKQKQYAGGVAERAAAQRAQKPKMGNLAEANQAFKPGRDGPMTIGQVLSAQKAVADGEQKGGLSKATIDGMNAIAKAAEASRSQKAAEAPKETRKMDDQKPPTTTEPPAPPKPMSEKEKTRAKEHVDQLDDLEIEQIMRSIQNDVINNTKEKDHVNDPANKRLTEVDFAQGIAEGEFTQIVDVIPGKLKVHYRTMTPMENQSIRLWIFDKVSKDPRLDRISGEMFGLGLIVATVIQIGSTKYPDHLTRDGQGVYSATFNDEAFAQKFDKFARMPQPLIHAVGTHGQWFDMRIRSMFTTDYAKNG